MACTNTSYRTRRRSLPPSRRSWWTPAAVLFSVSVAVAVAFQASPSSHHHSTTTPTVSRLCMGEAYRARRSSWSSANVEARPPGPGSQRRYPSDPAATTTALASMAPGAGVLAQEENDRTRCVGNNYCVGIMSESNRQPGKKGRRPWLFLHRVPQQESNTLRSSVSCGCA